MVWCKAQDEGDKDGIVERGEAAVVSGGAVFVGSITEPSLSARKQHPATCTSYSVFTVLMHAYFDCHL